MKRVLSCLVMIVMLLASSAVAIANEEYETFNTEHFEYRVPKGWITSEKGNARYHYAKTDGDPSMGFYYVEEMDLSSLGKLSGAMLDSAYLDIISSVRETQHASSETNDILKQIVVDDGDAYLYGTTMRSGEKIYHSACIIYYSDGNIFSMMYTKDDNKIEDLEYQGMLMASTVTKSKNPYKTESKQAVEDSDMKQYEVKEYKWSTKRYHHFDLVIKNTSDFDAHIEVTMLFYDKKGNIIGVKNGDEEACQRGYETFWSFSNDEPFDHAEYTISMTPDTYYKGVQSNVELSANIVKNKVIITAKNTGATAVNFLEYNLIMLDKKGTVVDSRWGYLTDKDNELKPGKTEFREEKTSKKFATVELYAKGR